MGKNRVVRKRRVTPAGRVNLEQLADLLIRMRQITRQFRIFVNRLSDVEERGDKLEYQLQELQKAVEALAALQAIGVKAGPKRKRTLQDAHDLRQTAKPGAFSLDFLPRFDGSAEVRIDGGKQFTLPPTLADLLHTLSIDSGQSDDDLIGWKTLDEVAILLGKKAGKKFRRHAVTHHVYRLRKELILRGGINPFLVQTNRRYGVRFALRRETGSVIKCDSP